MDSTPLPQSVNESYLGYIKIMNFKVCPIFSLIKMLSPLVLLIAVSLPAVLHKGVSYILSMWPFLKCSFDYCFVCSYKVQVVFSKYTYTCMKDFPLMFTSSMRLVVGCHHLRECTTVNIFERVNTSTLSLSMSSTMTSSSSNLDSVNVVKNDIIYNNTSGYVVMDILGTGSFGKVAKCFSLDTAKMVAIKFLNVNDETISQEVKMLKAISVFDSDKKNLVKFIDSFKHNDVFCMVFEMLDMSLFHLIRKRKWSPLSFSEIRPVVHQLLVSLEALKSVGIIHGDLKVDNVMLVHQEDQPFKIRLIDFGLAIQASEAEVGQLLQNPHFRAPEIMLGLPLTEAVDIWSLGCIMLLLVLTDTPFPEECYYGWMENLVRLVGQPEDHLLAAGEYTKSFFILEKSGWRLMTPVEFQEMHHEEPDMDKSQFLSFKKKLEQKTHSIEKDKLEQKDKMAFFNLLNCCLQVDPKQRISPSEALRHPFITMVHMAEEMETSSYADTALELMIVSPLDNLDESPANTVTSENSRSISSSTASAIKPVDVDDVKACSQKPFTKKKKPFQRIKNFFRRVAQAVVRKFKPACRRDE